MSFIIYYTHTQVSNDWAHDCPCRRRVNLLHYWQSLLHLLTKRKRGMENDCCANIVVKATPADGDHQRWQEQKMQCGQVCPDDALRKSVAGLRPVNWLLHYTSICCKKILRENWLTALLLFSAAALLSGQRGIDVKRLSAFYWRQTCKSGKRFLLSLVCWLVVFLSTIVR